MSAMVFMEAEGNLSIRARINCCGEIGKPSEYFSAAFDSNMGHPFAHSSIHRDAYPSRFAVFAQWMIFLIFKLGDASKIFPSIVRSISVYVVDILRIAPGHNFIGDPMGVLRPAEQRAHSVAMGTSRPDFGSRCSSAKQSCLRAVNEVFKKNFFRRKLSFYHDMTLPNRSANFNF